MKLNRECLEDIMKCLEDNLKFNEQITYQFFNASFNKEGKYEKEEVYYSLEKLSKDLKYIIVNDKPSQVDFYLILDITIIGHTYIKELRAGHGTKF